MKLIIEMPDSEYNDLKGLYLLGLETPAYKTFIEKTCVDAIANGKVFEPKVNCKDCDGYEAGYSAGVRDTERPQGEWKKLYGNHTYCSKCKKDCEQNHINFCGYCGADMR